MEIYPRYIENALSERLSAFPVIGITGPRFDHLAVLQEKK
jgi:hypothetical protein